MADLIGCVRGQYLDMLAGSAGAAVATLDALKSS
jgi:hypothetical protein